MKCVVKGAIRAPWTGPPQWTRNSSPGTKIAESGVVARFSLALIGGIIATSLSTQVARAAPRSLPELPAVSTLPMPRRLALPRPVFARTKTSETPYFIDTLGKRHAFEPVQAAWFGELEPKPHYVQAAVEAGLFLGLQTISYWARPAANQFDWDDPAFKNRINLTAVRFDNNLAFTNFVLHPLSGAGSYWIARVNDVSVPESALYSSVSSIVWEFALEWREEVSLNDMIVTPAGGIPLGAFASELSDYLNSVPEKPTVGERAAETVLGFPRLLHPWRVDPNSGPGRLPPDSLGFSSAFWHRFRIGFESASVDDGNGTDRLNGIGADGELVSMAGFLRPGRFSKVFAHDNFTEVHVHVGFTPTGHTDVQFRSTGTLVGWYSQNFRSARHGVVGHGEMLGLANGLKYVERTYARSRDMYSTVDIFGLSSGLWLGLGRLKMRLLADTHYDFGAAQSLSLAEYRREHPYEKLKSVLDVQGYDYGMGPFARARGEVSTLGVTLGGYVDYGFLKMIGGLDRWEERKTHEVDGRDTILEYGGFLRFEPPWIPLYFEGALDFTQRTSKLSNLTTNRDDTRIGASAGLNF